MLILHSGSHAIAWAAIVTSVSKVSYDLQVKSVAYSSTLRGLIKVLVESEGHKMEDRI